MTWCSLVHCQTKLCRISMKLSYSSEAASRSRILKIIQNINVHCRVHTSPLLVPILRYTPSLFCGTYFTPPSHLRQSLPSSPFFWISHQSHILIHACHMPCRSHLRWLNHCNYIEEGYKLSSCSLCNFIHPHIISFIFGPNILLSIMFSNISAFTSSFDPIQSYWQHCNIYILVFMFLDSRRDDKCSELNDRKYYPN
jgi:hypothetical protein